MDEEKPIFYDTDCLSCFISIDDTSILEALFEKVIIPEAVYIEFSIVRTLKKRVDKLIDKNFIEIIYFDFDSEEYELFSSLSSYFSKDRVIGKGEAAAIDFAKKYNGIIASNNFRDIIKYVKKYDLEYITTGDILVMAYNKNIMTEEEGNIIWEDMLNRGNWLTEPTFSDYLIKYNKL